MAGPLQHHVHESRAPQTRTSGRIAADVASRFIDKVRRAEARAAKAAAGMIHRGIGVGDIRGAQCTGAAHPARGVTMTAMTPHMMRPHMGMRMTFDVMMAVMMRWPCRSRCRQCDDCHRAHRNRNMTEPHAYYARKVHPEEFLLPPLVKSRAKARHSRGVKRNPDVARTWHDQARAECFRGDIAVIQWRGLDVTRPISG